MHGRLRRGDHAFWGKVGSSLCASLAGLGALVLSGNLVILSLHAWAASSAGSGGAATMARIEKFQAVDRHLWRGARPTEEDYRFLATAGVTTIVDLRAEDGIGVDEGLLDRLGVEVITIPLRDGQAPGPPAVGQFLDVMRKARGTVFVHCMAGIGRTGTMVAAYLIEVRGMSPSDALRSNLSLGPPSLEQIAFVTENPERPGMVITALSRIFDAPRRLWSRLT